MIKSIATIVGTLLALGLIGAVTILTLTVIVWSFHVSFLYGIVAVVGSEVLPLLILILPLAYR